MFQLARQAQRRYENSNYTRTASPANEIATPGKQALTDNMRAKGVGNPDQYALARDAALRELEAVRHTALPNYVSIRRKQNMDPIAKQSELAKAAIQVRHLIHTANRHVVALERAESNKDPMIALLRARVEAIFAKAAKLGCYEGAMDMRPERFVDDSKPASTCSIKFKNNREKSTHVVATSKDSTLGKSNPKDGNTTKPAARIARGTSAPPAPAAAKAPAAAAKVVAPKASPAAVTKPTIAPVRTPVQRKSSNHTAPSANVQSVAAKGVASASAALPFASVIQRAFGHHDISNVRVQIGGAAAKASVQLGAKAYATGSLIAFAEEPDLHTAAHEAAHIIQQRHGISLAGGVDDGPADTYERHADAVADAVVAGKSVQHMFDDLGVRSSSTPVVQRKTAGEGPRTPLDLYLTKHENAVRRAIQERLGDTTWPNPSSDTVWQPAGDRKFARSLMGAIASRITNGDSLRALVHPLNVMTAMSHAQDAGVWSPAFGETVAYQIEIVALAALTDRVGPALASFVRGAGKTPAASDIGGTSVMDQLVARALLAPGVIDVAFVGTASQKAASKKARATTERTPSLAQLLAVEKSILRALDEIRALIAPFGAMKLFLSDAVQAVAARTGELSGGNELTRAKYAPTITFQHTQLLALKPYIAKCARDLRPIWDDKNLFSLPQREQKRELTESLETYVKAAGASHDRAVSTKLFKGQLAAEKARASEAVAQQLVGFDSATRSVTDRNLRSMKFTETAREQLETQRRAALGGKTSYETTKAITVAGEVALQNRMTAVGQSLDELRLAADAAGFSDLSYFRTFMPNIKTVPDVIAEVTARLADVNRTWDRAIQEFFTGPSQQQLGTNENSLVQPAEAPADWADLQSRIHGLGEAQRAFNKIAGTQSISSFIRETQRKVKHEAFVNAVIKFAAQLALMVVTGGMAGAAGRAFATAMGTGRIAVAAGFVADVAVTSAINTAVQMILDGGSASGWTMIENTLSELFTRGLALPLKRMQAAAMHEAQAFAKIKGLTAAERQMFSTMKFTAADITVDVIGGMATQWAAREIVNAGRRALATTDEEKQAHAKREYEAESTPFAMTVLQQGAAIGVGRFFHSRYDAWKQHLVQLRKIAGNHPDFPALVAAREQLFADAKILGDSLSPKTDAGELLGRRDELLSQKELALVSQISSNREGTSNGAPQDKALHGQKAKSLDSVSKADGSGERTNVNARSLKQFDGLEPVVLAEVTRLAESDPTLFADLLHKHGASLGEYVRFNPVKDLADLAGALASRAKQVRTHVDGLYVSIPGGTGKMSPAPGWKLNVRDGATGWTSELRDPNAAKLSVKRQWDPTTGTLTMDTAFGSPTIQMLPSSPALIASKGQTPAMMYVNLQQMRAMGIPSGKGAGTSPLKVVKMSTIQNVDTIGQLHWLRQTHPNATIDELIVHTASYRYAQDIVTQAGYRVTGARVVLSTDIVTMKAILKHYEKDSLARELFQQSGADRKVVHDQMLERYGIDATEIRAGRSGNDIATNFDIYLDVEPSND